MKTIFFGLICLALFSCSNENTDTSVDKNTNPVKLHTDIDTLPPPLDTLMFNKLALDCFYDLGKETDGEFYYKSAIESVHNTIINVIEDHAKNGSDIVFLIDKTGSMQNDIDSVRINLNVIIDQIEKFKGIRLGVAAYGDKNVDGASWYGSSEISWNYQSTRSFINKLQVSDGGDYPESVYDGLAKLITETDWRKDAKKMILVIGDAPSLEGKLTENSRKDIINLCTRNGIKANLFPVLVTPYKAELFVDETKYFDKIIDQVFPNPASDLITIKMTKKSEYHLTLLDLTGRVMLQETFSDQEYKLKLPDDVPNGKYVLRVITNDGSTMNAKNIVIQH